jgi:hypothetical protein
VVACGRGAAVAWARDARAAGLRVRDFAVARVRERDFAAVLARGVGVRLAWAGFGASAGFADCVSFCFVAVSVAMVGSSVVVWLLAG